MFSTPAGAEPWRRLQLGRFAQRVIDAGLPARPGRAEVFDDIGIDAQLERELWICRTRPAGAHELVAVIDIGALEEFSRERRGVVRIKLGRLVGRSSADPPFVSMKTAEEERFDRCFSPRDAAGP